MQTTFFPCEDVFIDYIKNDKKMNMKSQHYHDAYEIYLQISGERYLFLDNICHTLRRGDVVILKPFDIHYTESREVTYYERYVMNFQKEKLSCILTDSELDLLFRDLGSCVIHFNEEETTIIYNLFRQAEMFRSRTGFLSEKLMYTAVFQLLMAVHDMAKNAREITGKNTPPEIVDALTYINENYASDITLDTLSNIVHISKYHFCRQFHNATGATFLEYLYNVRLTRVHRLLTDTELPLHEIAAKTGFSSTAHLTRIFKQVYNVSPREFRREHKERDGASMLLSH